MQHENEKIIVGLDVGTSKICAVVGMECSGYVKFLGFGQCQTHGLRKGFVINIDDTAMSIRSAVKEAELMSGHSIKSAVVGIADRFIRGQNSTGMVTLKGREVNEFDVRRVIAATQAVPLLDGRKTLHIIPQEFIVDAYDGIEQPLGMSGERLEARVHLVSAASTSIANIVNACGKAELSVDGIMCQPLASAQAVLLPEERDLGVMLIDIGDGTTDIAIFTGGKLRHIAVIPVAGNHLTNDLAVGLQVSLSEAEHVKCLYGCCLEGIPEREASVELRMTDGGRNKNVTSRGICNILKARVQELFTIIDKELIRSGYGSGLGAGVVLTGGSSLLPGMDTLAEQMFAMPVRIGEPTNIKIFTDNGRVPQFASGVGLVLNGLQGVIAREVKSSSLIATFKRKLGRIWQET